MPPGRRPRSMWVAGLLIFVVVLSAISTIPLAPSLSQGGGSRALRDKGGRISDPRAADPSSYAAGEVLLKVREAGALAVQGDRLNPEAGGLTAVAVGLGFTQAREILPYLYKLTAPQVGKVDVLGSVELLQHSAAVEYASPNYTYSTMLTPDDEQYVAGQQWGLTQIKAEQAWDITTGSSDITIAILDTGTATNHPDLESKIVPGYDFANNDADPYDDQGHGTFTAGITAADSNNGTGIAGVSWGARIMPVKVLNSRGLGSDETIAVGIKWAVDHGAKIINASLGGPEGSPPMQDAAKYAHDHNVLIVAAAGNTPDGKPNYPAAFDSVLAVGATGRSDTYTGFSSWGTYVDVTAPGVGILSTGWTDGSLTYEYENGTSAAAPFVSGLAALVWSANPALTADQVKWTIEDNADDLGTPGWDEHYGEGRVNAFAAVQAAKSGKIPPTRTATPVGQATRTTGPTATAPPVSGPVVQVDTRDVYPGALLGILGAGFAPNELIDLAIVASDNSNRPLGGAQSGAQGTFRAEVGLPSSLPPGKATLVATGSQSKLKATADLNVTAKGSGQSVVRGTIRGSGAAQAVVHLKPSLGVSGPERTAQADAGGAYSFTGLAAGIYSLSASAPSSLPAGPYSVQVDGTASDVKTIDITLSAGRPPAFDKVPSVNNTATLVYFAPVGHTLRGPFLKFWQNNGGLAVFGYPLSEEFQEISPTDGKTYTVQYFERNRFEYHPEFAGTKNEVLMGLLGVELTKGRAFPPGAPFQGDATHAYFQETRHSLSGVFLKYWQTHGGLAILGYPISEEVMENGYLVQYFERNRFEYHPEFANSPNEVLLGLLGVEMVKRYGWLP